MDIQSENSLNERAESQVRADERQPPVSVGILDALLERAALYRRALARALLLGIVTSTLLAFVLPKRFESTVKIMPPDTQNPGALLAAVSGKVPAGIGELAGNLLGMKNPGPLYLELLRSRTVLDHQVDRFDLEKVYWTGYRYKARNKLASRTEISEDKKSGVITLVVTDSDPARAKALADSYVTELDQLLSSVSTSAARRERIFIERRLDTVKADLDAAERDFSHFSSKNSTLDIKEQTKAMVTAGAELQGRIVAADAELQALDQTYTENNVRVRAMKARIAEMKRQLARISGTGDATSTSLSADQMYPSIRQLPILGVEWANLFRKVKIQETVFELLTQQYELAKIQEAREIPTVRVIDPPDFPERKSWPPRLVIILFGTILSVAGALGWFWIRDEWALNVDDLWHVRLRKFSALFSRRLMTWTS